MKRFVSVLVVLFALLAASGTAAAGERDWFGPPPLCC
jgi:hypothetical protein